MLVVIVAAELRWRRRQYFLRVRLPFAYAISDALILLLHNLAELLVDVHLVVFCLRELLTIAILDAVNVHLDVHRGLVGETAIVQRCPNLWRRPVVLLDLNESLHLRHFG